MAGPRWRGGRSSSGVCHQFQRTGACGFGKNCRYSHGASSSPSSSASRNKAASASKPPASDTRVTQFKRLVTQNGQGYARNATYTSNDPTRRLFALGWDILNKGADAGPKQEVVTSLASEEGLCCIRDVVDRRIPLAMSGSTEAKCKLWELEVCPLFRLITHESVVGSTLLEEKIFVIYNFLAGVGGARLEVWFSLVVELAEASDRPLELSCIGLAELSLAVMSKMLDCGTSHIINDTFRDYAIKLSTIAADTEPTQPEDKFSKLQAGQYTNFIYRRLKVGESIPGVLSAVTSSASVQFPSFQLRRDLPGGLSADGRRHDNDHEDITKISIMPTPAEIGSTRGEYLPTIDPSSWHRPGILGRLDREFRLLREDTVGQLRDVVRTELEYLQKSKNDGADGANARLHGRMGKESIRYCTYDHADVLDVSFDRRTGVEFLVQFRQPAHQRTRKAATSAPDAEADAKVLSQRREWWTVQAKKRLQPGGLVCAIDAHGSVLFFTVAESTMRTANDKKKSYPDDKEESNDDSSTKYTLADHQTLSFVRLAFAGIESEDQMAYGLAWLHQSKINTDSHWHANEPPQLRVLVEFPGILLDSFLHTLKALQAGMEKLDIPFSDLIAPEQNQQQDGELSDIPPPKYAQKPGFVFDMSCLTDSHQALDHSVHNPASSADVHEKTRLNDTQSTALLEALSRSVALIQGPPGTGKTFAVVEILKVLLHNQKRAKLGPIIIVCYTNHALDQLLEHILDTGKNIQMLRMGSQSKSERLKDLNLRGVTLKMDRTRVEKHEVWKASTALQESTEQLQELLQQLSRAMSPSGIVKLLHEQYPEYYTQLFGNRGYYGDIDEGDDDGFITVRQSSHRTILQWCHVGAIGSARGGPARAAQNHETASQIRERLKTATVLALFSLTRVERHLLCQQWQDEAFTRVKNEIASMYKAYLKLKRSHDQARREVDLRCLTQANIVGMTTTGLARNLYLLKHLNSKVLVCEEAGEVLEAHMLASFLPSLEHAVLIGDHQQLRPQVQNYDLSSENPRGTQFSFDTSLFERLVSPPREGEARCPFSQLATQRRMHPSISALIRVPLYPALQDGPNVQTYPEVPGMARRLFWLQHQHLEAGATRDDKKSDPTSTSRTNTFEVEMTAALVSHLFKQGTYSSGDIAVLTPYLGQMMLLRQRLSSMFELSFNERDLADLEVAIDLGTNNIDDASHVHGGSPEPESAATTTLHDNVSTRNGKAIAPAKTTLSNSVRVATVDNFQGEEAKVVVVSLVRSNEQRQCGFLRTSNRINVLLSRAKHGMFIIGNSETCSGVPMWRDVASALEADGNMGPNLPLQCPRHPERTFAASMPDHFAQFAPDGGCMESCDKRLSCGHSCTGRCHSTVIHAAVKCMEPCPRSLKGCSHACPRPCGEPCVQKCKKILDGAVASLPCGHKLQSPMCWQAQDPSLVFCYESVQRKVPGCGHTLTIACHKKVEHNAFDCPAPCRAALPCGHTCGRQCFHCNTRAGGEVSRVDHGVCKRACGRPYGTCQHACSKECHGKEPCPPCTAPCDIRCSHSKCDLPCNEPCVPCAEEKCASSCPHSVCTMPCAAPCDWIPCSQRCTKLLVCGHQCPSVCGEQCPSKVFCQQCGDDAVLDQEVDFIMMSTYRETNLDEDPCIFPSCGHILTMSSMDGIMDIAKHYTMAESAAAGLSHPVALATSSSPFDMKEAKVCPQCRGSLRNVARYGRIVRRAVLDESTKRFIRWARQMHDELAMKIMEHKEQLEDTSAPATPGTRGGARDVTGKRFLAGRGRSGLIKGILLSTDSARYGPLVKTRDKIAVYAQKVEADEQPYQRVAELVRFAQNRRATSLSEESASSTQTRFAFDESVIQVGSRLYAAMLLMRCDILALEDIASHVKRANLVDKLSARIGSSAGAASTSSVASGIQALHKALRTNKFAVFFKDLEATVAVARAAKCTRQETEGHICYAQLCVVLRTLVAWDESEVNAGTGAPQDAEAAPQAEPSEAGGGGRGGEGGAPVSNPSADPILSRAWLTESGIQHVADAKSLMEDKNNHSLPTLFGPELQSVEQALLDLPFYQPVTAAERRAVYAAMAGEFRGSGHWYECANGHPFTIGECGMPMEQARCPECGAGIGGRNHTSVEGVTAAEDMEALGQAVGRLAVE